MRKLCFGITVAICLVALSVHTRAQQGVAAAPKHIRILAAGGLLGQHDGMPEYPGGPYDTEVGPGLRPYGGLQGLIDWIAKDEPHDLLLITANNLPRSVSRPDADDVVEFFRQFGRLRPDAIALGVDDFLRGLDGKRGIRYTQPPQPGRPPKPPRARDEPRTGGLLTTSMREAPLPFIVSNAAVRLTAPGLNHVIDRGFRLSVTPDSSIAWVRDLSVTYPCRQREAMADSTLTLTRKDGQTDRTTGQIPLRLGDKGCTASARLQSWLQPSSEYAVLVSGGGQTLASFTVRTDERLSNRTVIDPGRQELPLIVAMVDPHVRDILSREKWQWTDNGNDSRCTVAGCEIIILPPADALDQVLSFEESAAPSRPVLLLSQLDDKDTSALLQRSQRIRYVVLPPESGLLGRAAPRTVGGRAGGAGGGQYSGDLGYGAILNPGTPAVAQIWSRPEWFAEAIHEMEADVSPDRPNEIINATHAAYSVKGRALCARSGPVGGEVTYFLKAWHLEGDRTVFDDDVAVVPAGTAPYRYVPIAPDRTFDPNGRYKQGDLWTSLDSFAAVALDAMRRTFNTDLALLPANAIDDNWFTYLRDDPYAPRNFLSRVLLERLLFRAGTIITVRVSAAEVGRKLTAIYDSGRASSTSFCVAGFGTSSCGGRGPGDGALLNGRRVDENRYYTIAMPESVGLENRLTRLGDREEDLVDVLNHSFAAATGSAPDSCAATPGATAPGAASSTARRAAGNGQSGAPASGGEKPESLGQMLERVRSSENSPYLYIKPAEFSFSGTQVVEPPGGEGLFNKLPVPSNGARPSQRSSVLLGVDFGMIDTRTWALRALGKLGYGNSTVNGQASIDPNAWLTALRADWKLGPRGRFYTGLYWESQFSNQVTFFTASSKGVIGPTLPLVARRRDYRYLNVGFELQRPQLTRWLSLDPFGASASVGVSMNEHVDIAIDGNRQGLAALQKSGTAGLLNAYFATHPGLSADSTYAFIDEPLMRSRVQVDVTPRIKLPFPGKTLELTLASSYRRFIGQNMPTLVEKQSAVSVLRLTIPVYGLVSLNLSAATAVSQVVGIDGWYRVFQPSMSLSVPIVASRHGGWIF
ncbi:MAG TPA: hypothetical protein VFV78_09865 [Vicinamibacterales bacterium]|nr:hypothetical protein [Vicinamibacterales bacterium]